MSESFGHLAAVLSGLAARNLGWRPDEFWRATPAELAAALTAPNAQSAPIGRETLQHLMEQDHG
ncbi:phage tail assembly chaperone [Novosphingobium sp. RD2P27]|uniref:Phage tail assembly chaperone n=1 Tax=Novosphingobium kalidii TaxID=3230299 RepID=A0ABV2CZK1_9SPHN